MNVVKGKKGFQRTPLTSRFWSKVKKTRTCWLWTGAPTTFGYGHIWVNEHKKQEQAHRVAWYLATGKWPSKDVLHKCNVKLCIRHSHHYLGGHKENAEDMYRAGKGNLTGKGAGEMRRNHTHCPHGHPYSGSNLRWATDARGRKSRKCRECDKVNAARQRLKEVK